MRTRSALLLILLMTFLVTAAVWFAWQGTRKEGRVLQLEARDLAQRRIDLLQEEISRRATDLLTAPLKDLDSAVVAAQSAREMAASDGRVTHVFCLDRHSQLILPRRGAVDLSADEQDFLSRIGPVAERGGWAQRSGGTERSDQTVSGSAFDQPSLAGYRARDGIHFAAFRRMTSGSVCGVELNTARFISDLLNSLHDAGAKSAANRSVPASLFGDNNELIFEWGRTSEADPKVNAEKLSINLDPPLQSFRLSVDVPEVRNSSFTVTFVTASGVFFLAIGSVLLFIFLFREYRRSLREAEQRVSFVNKISHELRTPLTNIRLYAELLEGDLSAADDPAGSARARTIVTECERLSRLVGNVLRFGESAQNTIKVRRSDHDLRAIAADLERTWDPSFSSRGMKLECEFRSEIPETIFIDRDALVQILANLLSNAEKYARTGTVTVSYEVSADTLRVVVTDQGPGVPIRLREEIFRPFFRVSDRVTEGVTGTGIGLGIARELARLHGGDLVILESGVGLHVEITLEIGRGGPS